MKPESTIVREILRAIGAYPDLFILTNSVGRASYVSDAGKPYTVPYGLGDGSPDLVAMLTGPDDLARWVCLEVKRPGENPRPNQLKCHEMWRARGALVYVVRSDTDAIAAIADARLMVTGRRKRAVNS